MKAGTPFRRVSAFMGAMQALMAQGAGLQQIIAQLGTYQSRGKGLGKVTGKKFGNTPTPWHRMARSQNRETARRRRQIKAGTLTASNGLVREPTF